MKTQVELKDLKVVDDLPYSDEEDSQGYLNRAAIKRRRGVMGEGRTLDEIRKGPPKDN